MKPLLICIGCLLNLQSARSQDKPIPVNPEDTLLNPKFYTAQIFRFDHATVKGYLVTIKDSSIYLSHEKMPMMSENANLSYLNKFEYNYIEKVKVSKAHAKGKAILIGAIAGIVAGTIIGYSLGDDEGWFALTAGEKAFVGGLIGGGAGCIVGAIVGSSSEKKFLINGDWKSLQEMKESLTNNK